MMKMKKSSLPVLVLGGVMAQSALAAPVAKDDRVRALPGGLVRLDVLANDRSTTGGQLRITLNGETSDNSAYIYVGEDQAIYYQYYPEGDPATTDTFTYTLYDEVEGQGVTATVHVNLVATQEELAIREVLENACNGQGAGGFGYGDPVCDYASDPEVLDQLLGTQIGVQLDTLFLMQNQIFRNIQGRLQSLRSGTAGRGFSMSGFGNHAFASADPEMQALLREYQASLKGTAGSAGEEKAFADTPWGVFVVGRLNDGEVDAEGARRGYDFNTDTVTLGVDYRLNNQLILGGTYSYSRTSNDMAGHTGEINMESNDLAFFGNYYPWDQLYIDWIVTVSDNAYDGDRRLKFGSVDELAKFESDGSQQSASVSTGYDWSHSAWQYGAYLRLDYTHASVDAYEETDSSLALAVDEQTARSFNSALGARLNYVMSVGSGVLIPGIDLEQVHQWENDPRKVTVAFAESPESGKFGFETLAADQNYLSLGLSLSATFSQGRSAFVRYETLSERDNVSANTLIAGARLEF